MRAGCAMQPGPNFNAEGLIENRRDRLRIHTLDGGDAYDANAIFD